jgi:hypothetical protein
MEDRFPLAHPRNEMNRQYPLALTQPSEPIGDKNRTVAGYKRTNHIRNQILNVLKSGNNVVSNQFVPIHANNGWK